jgi:hypothetical protein
MKILNSTQSTVIFAQMFSKPHVLKEKILRKAILKFSVFKILSKTVSFFLFKINPNDEQISRDLL